MDLMHKHTPGFWPFSELLIKRNPGSLIKRNPGSLIKRNPGSLIKRNPGSFKKEILGHLLKEIMGSFIKKILGSFKKIKSFKKYCNKENTIIPIVNKFYSFPKYP